VHCTDTSTGQRAEILACERDVQRQQDAAAEAERKEEQVNLPLIFY
jgi:hypothetical protein